METEDTYRIGLKERIEQADSNEEIDKLLCEGVTFEFASTKTRRSWAIAANKRRAQLTASDTAPALTPRKR
jgi:hypothetical protein